MDCNCLLIHPLTSLSRALYIIRQHLVTGLPLFRVETITVKPIAYMLDIDAVAKFSNFYFLANPKPPLYSIASFSELIVQSFVKILYLHREGFDK